MSDIQHMHEQNTDTYGFLEETPLNLNSLIHKLQGQVNTQWYQFGLAIGVPQEILEQLNHYSEYDCVVEVLDYWLKHHPGQPTWQEVADAQRKTTEVYQLTNTTVKDGVYINADCHIMYLLSQHAQ